MQHARNVLRRLAKNLRVEVSLHPLFWVKKMYCFIFEDINILEKNNPLFLQTEYAKYIGSFCCFNIADKNFSVPIETGEKLTIRGTCENVKKALSLIDKKQNLFESIEDIEKIENWYSYVDLKRELFEISVSDFLNGNFSLEKQRFFDENEKFFLKSRTKNFSAVVAKKRISDIGLIKLIKERLTDDDKLLVSEYCGIGSDSLGKKEIRCFVKDCHVINSSRHVHSVKHSVPKSLKIYAEKVIDKIAENVAFPKNYVIDVAEFIKNGEKFYDVVELNPFSTSQCYVNNSIFLQADNRIVDINKALYFGYEYCLDYLDNPENYVIERLTQENYEYSSDSSYCFV